MSNLELLREIVSAIVSDPDQIEVTERIDKLGLCLILKVAREDMGKVIGRGGETSKAIRTVMRAAGVKDKARVSVHIEEPIVQNSDSLPVDS